MDEQMDVDTLNQPTQAQQNDLLATPPDLLTHHGVIIYSKDNGCDRVAKAFFEKLEKKHYKVKMRQITGEADDETMTADIRKALKVIMIVPEGYINATDQYEGVLTCIERLTDERREEVLIPVLMNVDYEALPPRLREGPAVPIIGPSKCYPNASDMCCLQHVVNLIGEKRQILPPGTAHIGTHLAWGHYSGYYKKVLPGLGTRIKQTAAADRTHWDCGRDAEAIPLMFAVIPKKGYPRNPNALDCDILPVRDNVDNKPVKAKYHMDRAGHPDKDYSHPLSCISSDNKEYVFTYEIPTTLKTLRDRTDDPSFKFSQRDHTDQLKHFKAEMERLLSNKNDKDAETCRQAVVIIMYDERLSLSEQIIKEIENWKKEQIVK